MSTITWVIPAIWIAGFVSGYVLRSYLSHRRHMRARRARYEVPTGQRTLASMEQVAPAQLCSSESASLVPADAA